MHSIRKVTDDLYWVGANDHRLHLFENIHPIPQGVSYNSYLLIDEQTVLFDTIDWSACRQLLENISFVLQDRPLDALVITHLEPDHAAALNEILLRFPQVKIIASAKCFQFMKQFGFHLDNHECVSVKEGDTQTFGKHTISFMGAPMVHWPEVTMAFDTTNGVLFSSDAFGSFIALDGKLFQDEVNFDRNWLDEARRYYTNIVGKYGVQTQGVLKKAAGILNQIKVICPLHGLVWRGNFDYLLDKYQRWSSYTPEDNAVMIAYASMYGNTESAAYALAARLCEKGVKGVTVYDVSNTHVSYLVSEAFRCSHIVLASATYNLNLYPLMRDFLEHIKELNLQNRTFALMENGTWACRAGAVMRKFVTEDMKNMTLLDETVSMTSTLSENQSEQLEALADAIVASLQK